MKAAARSRRDRIRAQLADLKMPGALEAIDDVLTGVDGGGVTASEAIEQLLGAQITLRNNRRLQAAMRSSRLPGIKTLDDFDFSFQPCRRPEGRGRSRSPYAPRSRARERVDLLALDRGTIPGVLTNGARTGEYRVLTQLAGVTLGHISREDIAHFMHSELQRPLHEREIVNLCY